MPEETQTETTETKATDTTATETVETKANGADAADSTSHTTKTTSPWPDDWRGLMAGDDKKRLKSYERYNSPKAMADSHDALRARMDGGEFLTPFPTEGSDKEKAAWRKDSGIPKNAEGYLENLPDGLVLSDDAKERATEFATGMHELNASPEIVTKALGFHHNMIENAQKERLAKDETDRQSTEEELISEMGLADYRKSVAGIVSWAESLPDGAGDVILNAREGHGGDALMNNPAVARALAQAVRTINPTHTVVPGSGADAAKTIADELAGLKKDMGNKNSDYWKGPLAERKQERYRELLEAKSHMDAQAA